MSASILRAAALAVAMLTAATPALAHKMKLFATAEGATVAGYAYFSPGGRARDVPVTAVDGDGVTVFRGRTDAEGAFRFPAERRSDLTIVVSGADGHEARFTLRAAELPGTLPGGPSAAAAPPPAAAPSGPPPDLAALIEASVARQVRPLREQLDAYEAAVGMRDVAGGLGYIIGLAGLAYGLSMRRRLRAGRES
ncbi:hypothetical protein [Azospirillum halopraeferens]|uniref:hypothetical protein n=1 Tax=Azospirillum halopraeferens TaxID=34010 RepID=UPI000421E116|nr:hypothetical protein [Azospirillum halopraeferens]